MTFEIGMTLCANCGEPEDVHCQTCWCCPGEPTKECCMEGWSEETKAYERRHWAARAGSEEKS